MAWPDHTGVARHLGFGEVSVIHFDAQADTGDTQFGSLVSHGTPMRRPVESGTACCRVARLPSALRRRRGSTSPPCARRST
ncbi:arginase family protein [Streptomyces sp. NPDC060028]|uniref:arginase family protein n=1 Tax=Streptomyces sp. NPDC060028 TaxID=3347041 RepID=UPI0036C2C82A